ncbi:MAG: hypothetical protein GWP08_03815 [Nitrospiraceae bacterium]|nr:hypothetical protein [Nitrospiraceae bacterium]
MAHTGDDEPLVDGWSEMPPEAFAVPPAPAALREAVLRRTSGVVRGRPRRMRLLALCAVAVAYGAGLLTNTAMLDGREAAPAPVAQAIPAAGGVQPVAAEQPPGGGPSTASTTDPRALLALVADATGEEQLRLLTRAGDLYLSERGDVARALYCYRQVLELTPLSEPVPLESGDTWLLTSLKLVRIQETSHESKRS